MESFQLGGEFDISGFLNGSDSEQLLVDKLKRTHERKVHKKSTIR